MAEFKISRLRFTYVGQWNDGNDYAVDDVITYSGKMYSCVSAHTASASFYTDLATKWSLIIDGISWFGPWTSTTSYDIGNIVSYKNAIYICTLNHTSGAAFDGTKFTTLSTFARWSNAWAGATDYTVGDIVKYGGVNYICNADHTSAQSTLTFPLTNIAGDGNTITATYPIQTVAPFAVGQEINITNTDPVEYAGTYTVQTVTPSTVTFVGLESQNFVPTIVSITGSPVLTLTNGTVSLRFSSAQDATDNSSKFANGKIFIVSLPGSSSIYTVSSSATTSSSGGEVPIQDTLSFTVTKISGSSSYSLQIGATLTVDVAAGARVAGANIGDLSGLEQNQSSWDILSAGIDFKGDYADSYRYKLNDVVQDGASLYICTETHTSAQQPIIDLTKFDLYIEGDAFSGVWDAAVAYQAGDTVVYGGYSYVSLAFNNVSHIPTESNSAYWELFNQSFSWQNQWSNTTNYKVGSVVRQGGQLYVAIQDNVGTNPTTTSVATTYTSFGGQLLVVDDTTGVSLGMLVNGIGFSSGQTVVSVIDGSTVRISHAPDVTPTSGATINFIGQDLLYWKLVAPGTVWTNFWSNGGQYIIGDIVVRGNTTYRCVQNHTSNNSTNRPDLDTANAYWIVYTLHTRSNVLTNQGDIVTHNGTTKTSLSINPVAGYAIKSTGSAIAYSKIFTSNNVFYVAPNGVDEVGYGTTWDQPWATIKYACNYVKDGTQNTALRQVLSNNKDFIVAEMYNWMLYQKQQSTNGFTPASVFDATKTQRDAYLILDALIYDVSRGGNSQSVAAALSYFEPGSTTNYFNTETSDAMPYIIAALGYLSTLVTAVGTGTPPANNYQGLMGVPGNIIEIQSFGNSAPSATPATDLLTLIITALSNQSTASLPPANSGATVTINVKTGTYREQLPITIPENTAVNGDELRGAIVQPFNVVNTIVTNTLDTINTFTAYDTTGMYIGCPIQFVGSNDTGATNLSLSAFETEPGGRLTDATVFNSILGTSITGIGTYSFVSQKSTSGTGTGATFVIDKTGSLPVYGVDNNTTITLVTAGSGYAVGDTITISGAVLGGTTPTNDLTFTIGTTVTTAIVQGTTYYVAAPITPTSFRVATTPTGTAISLVGTFGLMQVFGGDALKDMFYMRNGSGLRNLTLSGLLGTLGPLNENFSRRPTGKSYVSLDPGTGPDDSSVWIKRRSPYVQNVTAFGIGCTGLKIDGDLHNGGNKSIVCNDYTHIIGDGIGIWCTGTGGLCEAVSVFSYYGYAGYLSDGGGRIRATNGNSSYGTYGVIAEGYDLDEEATTGFINNKYLQATATPGWVGGANSGIIKYAFTNAGQNYVTPVTNMLTYSNNFVGGTWSNDSNVAFSQNLISPSTYNDAWVLTAATSTSDSSYFYQNVAIVPSNGFTLTNQPYVLSLHVKQGTSATVDLFAIFSGSSTRTSKISFNFATKVVTPGNASSGVTPSSYGVQTLDNGWYRIWFATYDNTALNTQLQFRVYPRGLAGSAGYVYAYGAQLQNADTLGFYLETANTRKYTAYSNFDVRGNGVGVQAIGNEIRSKGVIETRITTDAEGYTGGANYLTSSNNAITGTTGYIQLANSETNLPTNYEGMRVVITGGTGSGQYGVISRYTTGDNTAYVIKESFTPQVITAASNATGRFTLDSSADVNLLRVNQPVQFVPQYYTSVATKSSQGAITATATIGGQTNTLTVSSTTELYVGMPITFSGTTFGGVINNYIYYITQISGSTIKLSLNVGGTTLFLNTATGTMTLNYPSRTNYLYGDTTGMTPNLPIQFTGTVIGGLTAGTIYYINDVVDSSHFTVSAGLISTTATQTFTNKNITVGSTTAFILGNPIVFNGTTFGGITAGTKYYVTSIEDASTVRISDSLISTTTVLTTNTVITLASTTGLVVNNPIYFKGNPFGGLVSDQLYYIKTISGNDITISSTIAGTAVSISAGTGYMAVRSPSIAKTLTAGSGTMTVSTTSVQLSLSSALGNMNVVYQSSLFGGVVKGTTYYVLAITAGSPNTFTITATDGGTTPVTLTTTTGSMLMAEAGWDHVVPGTAIQSTLNLTTSYFIEPKITYSDPAFSQTAVTLTTQSANYTTLGYGGGYFLGLGTSNVISRSADGTTWSSTTGPASATWSGIAYGNGYWLLVGTGASYYSNSVTGVAADWKAASLPVYTTPDCAYGAGVFVIIDGTPSSNQAAYSTTFGSVWQPSNLPATATWKSVAYGEGVFVAVATGGTVAAYSTDLGITWSSATLPRSTTWSSVAFGAGRYVAVSSTSGTTAYSLDGINWTASLYSIAATKVAYGQGVFLAVNSSGTTAYTSEDGITWKQRTVTGSAHTALVFGYTNSTKDGVFITAAGTATGSRITAGARAKGRPVIATGRIGYITNWEAGSGYTSAPTVTVFDPNQTTPVSTTVRTSNGVLGNPTIISEGSNYISTSTYVTITGDGRGDKYQVGLYLYLSEVTVLPAVGDNLTVSGINGVYKITSVEIRDGSSAPSYTLKIGVSPDMSNLLSPAHGTAITIRQKFSQARLTNHDFLNIGFGDVLDSNYPGLPAFRTLNPNSQTVESNYGRVFYTSTDQDGNFKVGDLFGVQQSTGIVTISASQFGLTGLQALTLGGIAVGGSSVIINQFSTDPTFVANSDNIIPTQKAVKTYIFSRLSQGGSNTFTGNTIAGSVSVGGTNIITSTFDKGTVGSTINLPRTMRIQSPGGVDGNMMAQAFFTKTFWRR